MIDLYGMGSPNVTKVILALEELQLPYSRHHVAIHRGQQFEPAFLKLNPLAKVPVLIDERLGQDQPLFESGAILIYLAETYGAEGGGALLPHAGAARYEVLKWLMVQMANIGPMFGQLVHFNLLPPKGNEYAHRRYLDLCKRLYRVLDDRLAQADWLAGGAYSIADIATWPWARYVEIHGLSWADYPALKTWIDRIEARPAAQRTLASVAANRAADAAARQSATPADLDKLFWRSGPGPVPLFVSERG